MREKVFNHKKLIKWKARLPRVQRRMMVDRIAEGTGYSAHSVWSWINGRRQPPEGAIHIISQITKIPSKELWR